MIKYNHKTFNYAVSEDTYGALYDRIVNDSCIIRALCTLASIKPEDSPRIKHALEKSELLQKELSYGFTIKAN